MFKVTYISLQGEIKQVDSGSETPQQAKSETEYIYDDCAMVMFVTNIYSGEVTA